MRLQVGRVLILLALGVLVVGAVGTPRSLAAEVRTFADDFSNQSYSANDGTHTFEGPWSEGPIQNGANRGNITIDGSGCSGGCLSIGEPLALTDSKISRTVSIEGANSARLDFTYRRDGSVLETSVVVLSVHEAGRSRNLGTFALSKTDPAMVPASFDITSHAGPETTIRFAIIGVGLTDSVLLVDDVVITATFDEQTTTTTTRPGPPSTTTTSSTSTTSPPTTTTVPTTSTSSTTTTTQPTTTSTTRAGTTTTIPGTDPAATTTTVVPPSQTPDFATDKAVLVSSSEDAAMAVMQPMGQMSAQNRPQSIRTVAFVNAAESVRSTAAYGVGVGLLLAGFLLVGFDEEKKEPRRRNRH